MEAQYGSAGNLAHLFAYMVLLVFAAVTGRKKIRRGTIAIRKQPAYPTSDAGCVLLGGVPKD
jgi:hypothetical protein